MSKANMFSVSVPGTDVRDVVTVSVPGELEQLREKCEFLSVLNNRLGAANTSLLARNRQLLSERDALAAKLIGLREDDLAQPAKLPVMPLAAKPKVLRTKQHTRR